MKRFFLQLVFLGVSVLSFAEVSPREPHDIVSLTLMTDEFLLELVPSEQIKALSRTVDDPAISNVVSQAKAVKERAWLNLELLLRLKPGLILAADWNSTSDLEFLRQKGYAVYVVKTPRTWAEVKEQLTSLAKALKAEDAARSLLDKIQADERQLRQWRTEVASVKMPTLLEYNPFGTSMGSGTLWNDLVSMAGLKNAAEDLAADNFGYAPLSKEMLLKINPDFLVLPTKDSLDFNGQEKFLEQFKNDVVFQALKAVRTGQVLLVPDSLKTCTSPFALRVAFQLIHAAYPNLR